MESLESKLAEKKRLAQELEDAKARLGNQSDFEARLEELENAVRDKDNSLESSRMRHIREMDELRAEAEAKVRAEREKNADVEERMCQLSEELLGHSLTLLHSKPQTQPQSLSMIMTSGNRAEFMKNKEPLAEMTKRNRDLEAEIRQLNKDNGDLRKQVGQLKATPLIPHNIHIIPHN